MPEALRGSPKPDESEPLAYQFHGSAYTLPLTITAADPENAQSRAARFQAYGCAHGEGRGIHPHRHRPRREPEGWLARAALRTCKSRNRPRQTRGHRLPGCHRRRPPASRWSSFHNIPTGASSRVKAAMCSPSTSRATSRCRSNSAPPSAKVTAGMRSIFGSRPARSSPSRCKGWRRTRNFSSRGGPAGTRRQRFRQLPAIGWGGETRVEKRGPESEGRLFYAAEMLSQISLGPGLMRQAALLDFKVMQGELSSGAVAAGRAR